MKFHKILCPWGLWPINLVWATWAQKPNLAIIAEPWHQLSQTEPHFLQNHKMIPIKL